MSSGLGDQREGLEMYLNTNGMECKLKYKRNFPTIFYRFVNRCSIGIHPCFNSPTNTAIALEKEWVKSSLSSLLLLLSLPDQITLNKA